MKYFPIFFLALLLSLSACSPLAAVEPIVDPAKLDSLARPVADGDWVVGLAIGLINERGTQTAGYGHVSGSDASAPKPDTIFEIGSISKVFTGLLLAQMVEEHIVALDEPVQRLLGDTITMPKKEDREITLVDLATHSSGLPRMPSNFAPKDPNNPYADYTVEQMAKFISGYKLRREPGKRSEYSNLGMGLLGHALALKSDMPYQALVRKRICDPLSMTDTLITLDDARRTRLAQGHDPDGQAVANWDLPTLAGAGALRSTTADMLKFLAANIGLAKTSFDAAILLSQQVHFKEPDGPMDQCLGWAKRRADEVVWHNGQTGGYHSFTAFSRAKRCGVVVLTNSTSLHVDDLGFRILELLTTGEAKPLDLLRAMRVEPAGLEKLVGKYQIEPAGTIDVTRENDALFIQLTGQDKVRVYASSPSEFFCRVVPANVSFEADDAGKIVALTIHQNGSDVPAKARSMKIPRPEQSRAGEHNA